MSRFRALKNRNYRLFFTGQMISMVGTWMQTMVESWLVYRLTGSAFWLGMITFCTQAAAFCASPIAGSIVDRWDRRKLLLRIEFVAMTQAFVLAALVFTGVVQVWHILILGMVLGVSNSFEITTRHTFAMDIVGKRDLPSAIALTSIAMNVSRVFGPALAGILISLIGHEGEAWCFFGNGLSFLAVIVGLLRMTTKSAPKTAVPAAETERKILRRFADGLRYARATPLIFGLLLYAAFISFAGFPYTVLLPVIAKTVLHGNADTLAWLMGASGVGAIIGGLVSAGEAANPKSLRGTLIFGVAGLGTSFLVLGASTHFWLSVVACIGIGYFLMGSFPRINNRIQQTTAEHFRGRMVGLYTMTYLGSVPLGSVLDGWLVDRVGVRTVALGIGVAAWTVGVGMLFLKKEHAEADSINRA